MNMKITAAIAFTTPLITLSILNVWGMEQPSPGIIGETGPYWRCCDPLLIPGESGSVILIWGIRRNGYNFLAAQKISSCGSRLWDSTGVLIYASRNALGMPGGIHTGNVTLISWLEKSGKRWNLRSQRIDGTGRKGWKNDGIIIFSGLRYPARHDMASASAGGGYITLRYRDASGSAVYVQGIDSKGTLYWKGRGKAVGSSENISFRPLLVPGSQGGVLVSWMEYHAGQWDIMAQRISRSGRKHWKAGGIPVCDSAVRAGSHNCVRDGEGGMVITWMDRRRNDWDIYAQRISPDGETLWKENGIPVCRAPAEQAVPRIAGDGSGGAFIAWADRRSVVNQSKQYELMFMFHLPYYLSRYFTCPAPVEEYRVEGPARRLLTESNIPRDEFVNIYCQHMDGGGNRLWGENGIAVSPGRGLQWSQHILSDGKGGLIITWLDYRSGRPRLFVSRLNRDGEVIWAVEGISPRAAGECPKKNRISSCGRGSAAVAWISKNAGGSYVMVHMMDSSGETGTRPGLSYRADYRRRRIKISWALPAAGKRVSYLVSRSEDSGSSYIRLDHTRIRANGINYYFSDSLVCPGNCYIYRVSMKSSNTTELLFETEAISIPRLPLKLYQNYPNPFGSYTVISYYIPSRRRVTIRIYHVSGRLITTLLDRVKCRGRHNITWKGINRNQREVAPGVYFCRIDAEGETASRKMVVMK